MMDMGVVDMIGLGMKDEAVGTMAEPMAGTDIFVERI